MLRNTRKLGRVFEALEDRRMLAVSAMVGPAGNLTIIDGGANDTFVVEAGATAGSVVVTGVDGTTINGSSSATLSHFSGSVNISLGTGNNSASIADLTIPGGLSVSGGNGNDDVIIGAVDAAAAAVAPAVDTVSIGGNLLVLLGGGANTVTVGAVSGVAPDVTVGGTVAITVGGGNNNVTEDSTTITGSESILAGTGTDSVLIGTGTPSIVPCVSVSPTIKPLVTEVKAIPGVSTDTVDVGGVLVITVGTGNDTITEQGLMVGATESLYMGSGTNNVTIGPASDGLAPLVDTAITQLVDEGGVAIKGTLDALLGSGNTSLTANDLSVGGTLAIVGSPVNFGFNFGLGSAFGLGFGFGIGPFQFNFGLGSVSGGGVGGLFGTQTDTISLDNVNAKNAIIFPGVSSTNLVTIEGSSFSNLIAVLGNGAGSLTVGGTTTTSSTILVGLGSKNTYTGQPGNTLAGLFSLGLTPKPTAKT